MLRSIQARKELSETLWNRIRSTERFYLIGGVNVLEDEEKTLAVAKEVKSVGQEFGIPVIFKASWDKANRTSLHSYRGVGLNEGLKILKAVKREFDLPILTDIHETWQAQPVSMVADVLQIPSFLCRQTDLIASAAKTGCLVNIKRGQFASPTVMGHAVDKVYDNGGPYVMVSERGLTFGPNDLVFDPRQIVHLRNHCKDASIVVDVTHSCQHPPGMFETSHSSGEREMVPVVARAAVASGALDGVFLECHPDPENAPVDTKLQWPLEKLKPLIEQLVSISDIVKQKQIL